MRLRSDFWVAAYIRRCNGEGAPAMLRRRGALEAGAIFVAINNLKGGLALFGPAPHRETNADGAGRTFARQHEALVIAVDEMERRLARQLSFDPDIWIVEIEDRLGRHFLDVM